MGCYGPWRLTGASQEALKPPRKERWLEVRCEVCRGDIRRCRLATCPYVKPVVEWLRRSDTLTASYLFGATPPAVFVGEWGYPKVFTGPLIPPLPDQDTTIYDAPELWVHRPIDELLRYRVSLVRGKTRLAVTAARTPPRILAAIQEAVMGATPIDMEVWFERRPTLYTPFALTREAPSGPSAPTRKVVLAENPPVPRRVDRVVYDTDLRAEEGVLSLYQAGVPQRQIVRLLSVGLLGTRRGRRLVPTEWSITAVDDIIGNHLRRAILDDPPINEYRVFGFKALGNNVQYLLLPSAWMYEALEGWLTTPKPNIVEDYELSWGRKTYPENVVGAYHAARLPALEYLHRVRRQAGVIAFLEVFKEWVPLGVWRFREIGREAFKQQPFQTDSLREALEELGRRLTLPLKEWLRPCKLIRLHQEQRRLEEF